VQQIFVTRLAQRVSRKTVQNILGTLGSMPNGLGHLD
jgi:hypothetical protein